MLHRLGSLPWPEIAEIALQVAIAVAFIAAVVFVARRFGRGYAGYTAAVILFPVVSSGDFLGVGRYLLPAFPVFALAGAEATKVPSSLRMPAAFASAVLLVIGTALFASGFLIA
jgi:hypothetical protein